MATHVKGFGWTVDAQVTSWVKYKIWHKVVWKEGCDSYVVISMHGNRKVRSALQLVKISVAVKKCIPAILLFITAKRKYVTHVKVCIIFEKLHLYEGILARFYP